MKTKKALNPFETAKAILEANNIMDIKIQYDKDSRYVPKTKIIYINNEILNDTNMFNRIAAIHECGHVIQHYCHKLVFRIIAAFSIITKTVRIITLLSLLCLIPNILNPQTIVILFLISAILHTVNGILLLPLEKDASARGLKEAKRLCLLTNEEHVIADKALRAAFYTYIYNVLCGFIEIVIFVILLGVL